MKNKLSLFGFLGFLGLLGLFADNPGFFGFFGFLKVIPDEMLSLHVNKAAKNAFFTGVALYPIIAVVGNLTSFSLAFSYGFAINFAVQILVFSISLTILEMNGWKNR